MANPKPPPVAPPIAPPPPRSGKQPSDEILVGYNIIADKVGGVPNFRKRDNLYQGISILVCVVIGAVVGAAVGGWPTGVGFGALIGLIAGVLLSGAVLMVVGLLRKP